MGVGLVAAILAGMVLRDDAPRAPAVAPRVDDFNRWNQAVSAPQAPSASIRETPRVDHFDDEAVARALADFDRALAVASEEELDLVAAAHLPDIVRRDPHQAARFIELMPQSERRAVLIRHFSRLWGESDAEGAFAWARTLPNAQESDLARRSVCLALGQANPAAAVERCAGNGADVGDESDFQGIFQAWAQSDPASARLWLAAQPEGPGLDRLRQRYVHVLAKTSPVEALRITQEAFTVPSERDEALLAVLHQWGLQDPRAARDWAETQSPEDLRSRALAEIDGLESYAAGR